jgi:hypothetical protein
MKFGKEPPVYIGYSKGIAGYGLMAAEDLEPGTVIPYLALAANVSSKSQVRTDKLVGGYYVDDYGETKPLPDVCFVGGESFAYFNWSVIRRLFLVCFFFLVPFVWSLFLIDESEPIEVFVIQIVLAVIMAYLLVLGGCVDTDMLRVRVAGVPLEKSKKMPGAFCNEPFYGRQQNAVLCANPDLKKRDVDQCLNRSDRFLVAGFVVVVRPVKRDEEIFIYYGTQWPRWYRMGTSAENNYALCISRPIIGDVREYIINGGMAEDGTGQM